MSEFADHGERN